MKIGITAGVVIAILALVACLVPLKEVAYTVTVDYQDVETYYEDEPYEVSTTEPLDYEVVKSYTEIVKVLYRDDFEFPGLERECDYGDPVPKGYVVVKNTDDIAGTFTIQFLFWTRLKITIVKDGEEISWYPMPDEELFRDYHRGEKQLYLQPGESGVAEFVAYRIDAYETRDHGPWFWEYGVTGTKTVTSTEYKQVEKQRTVWKEHPETRYKKVTLLDYILHY